MAKEPDPPRPPGVPADAVLDPGGSRWRSGELRDGLFRGLCRIWRADGTPEIERNYDEAGRLEGPYRIWHGDGSIASEGSMSAGLHADGVHVRHAPAGGSEWYPANKKVLGIIRRAELRYSRGLVVEEKYFDEAGIERSARGKALDPAIAKREKKAKPAAQDLLAALVKEKK